MKKTRFSEEKIIAVLREQEGGMKTADVCRKHGINSATLYAWKAKYGGNVPPALPDTAIACRCQHRDDGAA